MVAIVRWPAAFLPPIPQYLIKIALPSKAKHQNMAYYCYFNSMQWLRLRIPHFGSITRAFPYHWFIGPKMEVIFLNNVHDQVECWWFNFKYRSCVVCVPYGNCINELPFFFFSILILSFYFLSVKYHWRISPQKQHTACLRQTSSIQLKNGKKKLRKMNENID